MKQIESLREAIERSSGLCIGIDPDLAMLPTELLALGPKKAVLTFVQTVLHIIRDRVHLFKLNRAFFDVIDPSGTTLAETIALIRSEQQDSFVIIDMKCGDTSNSMRFYVDTARAHGCDGLTVVPFMGVDVLAGAADSSSPAHFVIVRGSNPGSDLIALASTEAGPVWEHLLSYCAKHALLGESIVPIVALRTREDLRTVQRLWPREFPILVPGFGAQGLDASLLRDLRGEGWQSAFTTASRSVLSCFLPTSEIWTHEIDRALDDHRALLVLQ